MDKESTSKALREEAARLRRKDVNFPLSIGGVSTWLVAADWLERQALLLERSGSSYALLRESPFDLMAMAEGA